jgi:NADH-quinone oxidoreductase subunit G
VVRYPYGAEAASILAMVNALSAKRPELPGAAQSLLRSAELQAAAKTFAEAENGIILFGCEGTGLQASQALAQACTNLLVTTGHVGRMNNGLIGVWQKANEQGAWDMGFRPLPDLKEAMKSAKALYVVAADPAGDDPLMAETAEFLVVQDLFLTSTAKLADVVLPARSYTEREGTFTNGERRVQRYYPAVPEKPGSLTDFAVTGKIGQLLNLDMECRLASLVMARIAAEIPGYAGITYSGLAQTQEQWPIVGRSDLYYGGTTYDNNQGLGVQLVSSAEQGEIVPVSWPQLNALDIPDNALLAMPVTVLYDRGQTVMPSRLLHQRIPQPYILLSPDSAGSLGIGNGVPVQVRLNSTSTLATAWLDGSVPDGVALVPRSLGIPIIAPTPIEMRMVERVAAQ